MRRRREEGERAEMAVSSALELELELELELQFSSLAEWRRRCHMSYYIFDLFLFHVALLLFIIAAIGA